MIAGGKKTRVFPMREQFLEKCRDDPKIRWFELGLMQARWSTMTLSWRRRFGMARLP
jgi:hypothetical protein